MKKLFRRLCLVCFCVVLFAAAIGVIELTAYNAPGASFLGCRMSELGYSCSSAPLQTVRTIIVNLPLGLIASPAFLLLRPVVRDMIGSSPLLAFRSNPILIYEFTLAIVLILAVVHVFRTIFGVVAKLRRRSRT